MRFLGAHRGDVAWTSDGRFRRPRSRGLNNRAAPSGVLAAAILVNTSGLITRWCCAAWAALKAAKEAGAAAAEAARAAMAAAGAAYLHPLPNATQVKHILGSAAHAARAAELAAGDDRAVGDEHVTKAVRHATLALGDVLKCYPVAPADGGRIGDLTRLLDVALRR